MGFPLVVSVDPASPTASLSHADLSRIGHVYISAFPDTLDSCIAFIREATSYTVTVNVTAISSVADITLVLDAGAARVFVSYEQLQSLRPVADVSDERLALLLAPLHHSKEKLVDALADTSVGVYAHNVKDIDFITGWLNEYGVDNRPPVFISFAEKQSLQNIVAIGKLQATPIIPCGRLTTDPDKNPDAIPVGEALLAGVVSDRPDKLISTLVVDEQGVALGLAYSSQESVKETLRTGTGVYQSRKRGLWYKGATSGAVQEVVKIDMDCDYDCLRFIVRQKGKGFCHLETATCFGPYKGIQKLQETLKARKENAPAGSYTARLFSDEKLLKAKILEEAEELCDAKDKKDIAFEAADLIYFALTKCIAAGVGLEDVERSLDAKSLKVSRRRGDAKPQFAEKVGLTKAPESAPTKPAPSNTEAPSGQILMRRVDTSVVGPSVIDAALKRPIQKGADIMAIVNPIIDSVKANGDAALLSYAAKFDKASISSPVLKAPYPDSMMQLSPETRAAIDLSFDNIWRFHAGQKEEKPLVVETMPGIRCSRFVRPIEAVGCYVPGGTAVLPSTALMLGVPAKVAGCKNIVFATPPRPDGSVTPEVVYVAHKVGASAIVLAGGAQAVAALAYGTESVPKVDKILGPGNQFVTAGKMVVSNDTSANVSIDMPAGPSEVLVIADATANPAFVASDLLSQAEHGKDSQVVLIAVNLNEAQLAAIEKEVHDQAIELPRVEIVRACIEHSVTLQTKTIEDALSLSNKYAPEHLILQVANASKVVDLVENAGSVFIGSWTPESVGDYSAGVNHSLPTYGYAKQYSGVNLATYVKHVTSSELTEEGLRNVGGAVMQLAKVEELEAHRRAVEIRLRWADSQKA